MKTKNPGPAYRFEQEGANRSLVFVPPAGEDSMDIRLFLRGPAMDEARGDPFLSRALLGVHIPDAVPLTAPRQVHGTEIIYASIETALPHRPPGDGVILREPGVEGSLRFADCFPVTLASLFPSPWIAILHSGYKGVALNISGKTCAKLFNSGAADPSRTWAWIGPGISQNHYFRKKGESWTDRGLETFHRDNINESGDAVYFDLGNEIRRQLEGAGLGKDMICTVPLCTFRDYDVCYSYRRGDLESRMFLLARID
ncbi:MAG: polyphenol oxidase family protein [Aminivibrio sp.]